MKTNTKIVATLGVVAGLGVASIPAFSYAANVSGDVQIDTEVESSLAMRIHSNADQTCVDDDSDPETPDVCTDSYGFVGYNPATAQGSTDPAATASGVASQATGLSLSSNQADTTTLYSNISVRSNTGKFKLEVQDADTDTAMRNESGSTTENQYIPAGITTTEENGETIINPGVAGWALKGGDIASWTAITASTASPLTIKALDINTTNPLAYSSDITVNYAVSSGLTKTDTYSDIITYTATALDSDYSLNDGNMQDFSAAEHAEDAVGTEYNLVDSRDNNEYTAKKLADGNIWMTQNLRLVGARTLTSADSNVTTNFNLTASNSGTWCTDYNSAVCIDQSMVLDSGNASYGAYYNWYAATAGTGKYETSSGNATASICPKGWKLPTSTEFRTLYNNYNSSSAMLDTNGPAFVLSGYRHGGNTDYQGSIYFYWSSTASSSEAAYASTGDIISKDFGFTVRCVASS